MESAMSIIELYHICEVELIYNNPFRPSVRPRIDHPESLCQLLWEARNSNKIELVEESKVILLNNASRVLGILNLSSGSITGCMMDPRIIFGAALKAGASFIILAHNHPSGNLKPSAADISTTKKLMDAGKLLDIKVLDHIIITNEGYVSMAEDGYII
ncbi:RadC-like JAB domain-containing protein [bacterium A37T11]|nr:RadC-like JAB domain-containing protein [bacterium A37T11]